MILPMKRIFLLLLSLQSLLFTQDHNTTCYSLQLFSIPVGQKVSEQLMPECKLIAFQKSAAVRCGCFDTQKEAKKHFKQLMQTHAHALLVSTYRYRFDDAAYSNNALPLTKDAPKYDDFNTSFLSTDFKKSDRPKTNIQSMFESKDIRLLIQSNNTLQQDFSDNFHFSGFSIQGKVEQYISQDYRFREYTDFEKEFYLQFDLLKDGYFANKKQDLFTESKYNISHTQNLSYILKNDFEQRNILMEQMLTYANIHYYKKSTELYQEALRIARQDSQNALYTTNELDTLTQNLIRSQSLYQLYQNHFQTLTNKEMIYAILNHIDHLQLQPLQDTFAYLDKHNIDLVLQKNRYRTNELATQSYWDQVKLTLYTHKRVVDEMGSYTTIGIAAKLPLDFRSHEQQKINEILHEQNSAVTDSFKKILQNKIHHLYDNFIMLHKIIQIEQNDLDFYLNRIAKYKIIRQNLLPNINYNPDLAIVKISEDALKEQLQIQMNKIEIFSILSQLIYLTNNNNIAYSRNIR